MRKSNQAALLSKQLTIKEVAEILATSELTVRRMISRGELRAYRFGKGSRIIRIDPADLQALREEVNPITFAHVSGGNDD